MARLGKTDDPSLYVAFEHTKPGYGIELSLGSSRPNDRVSRPTGFLNFKRVDLRINSQLRGGQSGMTTPSVPFKGCLRRYLLVARPPSYSLRGLRYRKIP
jgi:hypothetical protein